MANDFLSNLSSRALQGTDLTSASSGLRPRLASRYESSVASNSLLPIGEMADIESADTFETRQKPRHDSEAVEQEQSEERKIGLLQIEQPQKRMQTPLRFRADESSQFMNREEHLPMSGRINQIHSDDLVDAPPLISLPTAKRRLESSALGQEEEDLSRSVAPLIHPVIAPHVEPGRVIAPHKNDDSRDALQDQFDSIQPKINVQVTGAPEVSSVNHPKVIPERIDITHKESQLLISSVPNKLVPAFPQHEHKSQTTVQTKPLLPTVHVTIGRIEVKAATTPNTSPKRNAHKASAMSLDEYLRRRQGSG
jgi:hypothetical protein